MAGVVDMLRYGNHRRLQYGQILLITLAAVFLVAACLSAASYREDQSLREYLLEDSSSVTGNFPSLHATEWNATQQEAYNKAVTSARSAERGGHAFYQPLKMPQGFVHEAELSQEAFEEQLVDMVKRLEPTYLVEALDWAESDDMRDNAVLRPMVHALEEPIIKKLDDEARIRVDNAVDAISKKQNLGLPEQEQLRAHLMAPLLLRIRARVHSQVSHYVVKMARDVVLKAAKSSDPAMQQIVGRFHNHQPKGLSSSPMVPRLTDGDLKMINALHDLDSIYKNGVIDKKDYNTQKAKLLSDWLKYSVNKAGGNSNEVLRIVFGGEVKGVTDTGIKNPSPISVHKKLAMEQGVATLMKDRHIRLHDDLVYQLIHSKAQWGDITGCGKVFSSPRCAEKWGQIKDLVQQYAREDETDADWGETATARDGDGSNYKRKRGGRTRDDDQQAQKRSGRGRRRYPYKERRVWPQGYSSTAQQKLSATAGGSKHQQKKEDKEEEKSGSIWSWI